jgi:hypothetical protein
MKTRLGFVSNSSSSSFIVIDSNVAVNFENKEITIPGIGETEFDWQFDRYYDFPSKLNFALLQAEYAKDMIIDSDFEYENKSDNRYVDMIYEVLKDEGLTVIENTLTTCIDSEDRGYIDHQSAIFENSDMEELFNSKSNLRNFLFSNESFIATGNDNS